MKDDCAGLIELIRAFSVPMEPLPVSGPLPGGGKLSAPGYRAIIFDIYGTLFLSGSGDIGTLADGAAGVEAERVRRLLEPFAGAGEFSGLRESFVRAVRERHFRLEAEADVPEILVEELWAEILGLDGTAAREFSVRFELAVNPVYPMPGLADTLRRLQSAGIPLGIVSNAQFFTPLLFEAFLGADAESLGFLPELCVYSFREGRAKPSPRLFEKAAEGLRRLGMEAGEALYLGNDMLNDIWAAKSAGLAGALFAGDRRSLRLREDDPRCRRLGPDHVIGCLGEVLPLAGIS